MQDTGLDEKKKFKKKKKGFSTPKKTRKVKQKRIINQTKH